MNNLRPLLAILIVVPLFTSLAYLIDVEAVEVERRVLVLELSGNISPSSAEYIEINLKDTSSYEAVIITINTFGGLGDSMFRIIDAVTQSEAPVIVFVYPEGGQALSAGTYILMASSLAAMAPFTLIGSAQPVVNGVPSNDTKLINFLVGKMRTLAELHGRNATQASRFITHNDNLGPEEALRLGVIEIIANDVEDLLRKADGMKVKTLKTERELRLEGVELVEVEPDFRIQLLSILSDPLISGILLSIGFLALIVGLSSPGFGAELLGGVLIILGLIGQGFNVNWAGLALIAMGSVLILYEFYSGGFGIAIVGGIILLSIGLILLVRSPPGVIYVSQEWLSELFFSITLVSAATASILGIIMYKALRVVKRGTYSVVPWSDTGRAVENIRKGETGYVVVGGEYRRVLAKSDIKEDQQVRIVMEQNGILVAEPLEERIDRS